MTVEVVVDDRESPNAARRHVIGRAGAEDERAWSLHSHTVATELQDRQCPLRDETKK